VLCQKRGASHFQNSQEWRYRSFTKFKIETGDASQKVKALSNDLDGLKIPQRWPGGGTAQGGTHEYGHRELQPTLIAECVVRVRH